MLLPLFVLVAVLIKLESRGPVFCLEERVSVRGARTFRIVRFRTRTALKAGAQQRGDFTRMGAFLHEYGLDELPELFNIWIGHMSLADPRLHYSHPKELESEFDAVMTPHEL
jgi:lipopolysaccharide/colanic/teichoic acid biosynthesis glycosyltransferase